SFMHPPFGFALFYLRGISDTLFKNGSIPQKVQSNDIYLGAIPWVLLQLMLVVIVIFFPQTVTVFLDKEVKIDLDKVKIEAPSGSYGDSKGKDVDLNELFKPTPPDGPASAAK
ncbi:MAG TPA: TRAP transporter large permease subunit, partial [Albitalea sp.]|nr:TRAP transporter large permease subunit [Albitalea sp.]